MNNSQGFKAASISLLVVLGLVFFIWLSIFVTNRDHDEMCNAYCECQVTQNCNYTFDYEDVYDCECK